MEDQTNNQETQDVATQPISPPPSPANIKTWVLLIGGILILGIGFTIGLLFNKNLSLTPQISPTPTPLFSPTPQAKTDPALRDTADWKTYTSSVFEFTLKYPRSMTVSGDDWQRIGEDLKGYWVLNLIDNNDPSLSVNLDVRINPKTAGGTSITKVEQTFQGYPPPEFFTFDNYPALKYKQANQSTTTSSIHVLKHNTLFQISGFYPNGSEELEKIIDQILSTFKFINK